MLKHTYGEAYIRRMHPKDKADSIITAYQMAAYQMLRGRRGKSAYVLVRRGFPHEVLDVSQTKRDLIQRMCVGRTFKDACRFFRVTPPAKREPVPQAA